MNNIQVFQNAQFGQIRTAVTENGEPLLAGIDVARALGYSRPADAISKHCKGVAVLPTPTTNQYGAVVEQQMKFIPEADVYRLIMRSKLPQAEKFQDYACEEVFPALRKTGMYATPDTVERMLADPDAMISALTALRDERAKRISAEAEKARLIEQNELSRRELQAAAPKVEYYEDVLSSEDTMKTTQIAKELGMGAVTLNEKLRALGVQYKVNGQWVLTYKYQNKGYTKTNTVPFIHRDGTKGTQMQTVWTEKGRMFIHEKLSN